MTQVTIRREPRTALALLDVVAGDSLAVAETGAVSSNAYLLETAWTTALGQTEAALTDGGKGDWSGPDIPGDFGPVWGCNPQIALRVIPAADVGWTGIGNVLEREVHDPGGSQCGHITYFNLFPAPAAGQFWVVRYYFACNSTKSHQHAACFWPAGIIEAEHWGCHHNGGATAPNYGLETWWGEAETGSAAWQPISGGSPLVMTAGTWYRHEFIMAWSDSTTFRVYQRVYDMAGTLLADYTTMRDGWTGQMLSAYYAAGRNFHRRAGYTGDDNIRCMTFGDGQSVAYDGHIWWADCKARMGTSITDFIGP